MYLVRSQEAVVLAVLLTLLADAVALARHPSLWARAVWGRELVGLLGGVAVIALGVQLLVRNSQRQMADTQSTPWGKAVFAALLATFVLAVYPEQLIQRTGTHLLTIVIGALILFAPMRILLTWLVPYKGDEGLTGAVPKDARVLNSWHRWGIVVGAGLLLGAFAFLGKISEGSGEMPMVRLLFVASIFVGLGLAGLLIAYAFLETPLGLGSRD